jgi:hypothetical protein
VKLQNVVNKIRDFYFRGSILRQIVSEPDYSSRSQFQIARYKENYVEKTGFYFWRCGEISHKTKKIAGSKGRKQVEIIPFSHIRK